MGIRFTCRNAIRPATDWHELTRAAPASALLCGMTARPAGSRQITIREV